MGLFSKSKTYRWNAPNFNYAKNYTPQGVEGFLDPGSQDFGGYGEYLGANVNPTYLELMFNDRDITDTDYQLFDPNSQKWTDPFEDLGAIRNQLTSNPSQFGTDVGSMDDAMLMKTLQDQNWIKDSYEYGDPYQRNLYYTPYEAALGMETGVSKYGLPMKWDDVKMKDNAASIHPNVDYSFWDDSLLSSLSIPEATKFQMGTNDKVQYWNDPKLQNSGYGFVSETNPWESGYDFDFDKKKKTVKSSGFGGILGGLLSLFPATAPVGYALLAGDAIANKNPLSLAGAGLGAYGALAGTGALGQQTGMLAAQEAGLNTLGWGGATTGMQGLLNTAGLGNLTSGLSNPYVAQGLGGAVKSAAQGGNPLVGSAGGILDAGYDQMVAPQVSSVLQDMGLSSNLADNATNLLGNYGTNMATSYLSSLGDNDSYSEPLSRQTSKATPSSTGSYNFLDEGLASGFGLPAWLAQQSSQPAQQRQDTAKGKMTNNQLGGYEPEKSTQYLVG